MTITLAWAALRRHAVIVSCIALLVALSARVLGVVALACVALRRLAVVVSITALPLTASVARILKAAHPVSAAVLMTLAASTLATLVLASRAVRRHPLSLLCTALLLAISTSLTGTSVPLALLCWALIALVSLAIWSALEPFVLRRLGCRSPGHLERERLDPALGPDRVGVLVLDAAQPWLGRGLRTLVISRALLDLLEDRALAGLLAQATRQVRAASLPGEVVVWLGNLPLLGAWCLSRGLMRLGRLLAIVVGTSLVVPLVVWPDGFIRWAGRLSGAAIVGLLGSALLSSGVSAAGLGLLLAWALVPGLQTLLNWEARQAETAADDATFDAGLGWELLEALETLAWAESVPPPAAPLGWLCRAATPPTDRADHIWRKLARS
jgi:hypothetical protein